MDGGLALYAKQAGLLWLAGFRQACCLHRVVYFCRSSQKLLVRTGQCFLLNGLIFLGSLLFLNKVVIPTLFWILPDQCEELAFQDLCFGGSIMKFYSFLRSVLIDLFYVLWFYPLYVFSFILSSIWYVSLNSSPTSSLVVLSVIKALNYIFLYGPYLFIPIFPLAYTTFLSFFFYEYLKLQLLSQQKQISYDWDSNFRYNDIAMMACERFRPHLEETANKDEISDSQIVGHVDKPAGIEGVIIGIGEQVYSALLLTIFYIEVVATGYIPFIGKAISFLLLSWIYAYYSFEYKWSLSELNLDKRLNFFETNWAFFAGFGSPCVLAIFFFSPLISYGVMAILFPLFVLTAIGTKEVQVISSQRRSWREEPRKLPIFYAANILSMKVLQLFPEVNKKVE